MTLNELIEKLTNIRNLHSAGDYQVTTDELLYDIYCGEIQQVCRYPILMESENITTDDEQKTIHFHAQDNGTTLY